ncbi:hypothetical protein SERLA73DRAFT_158881 [Serpula lacrymans var. lacrymans S7.3]|uniref:Uncharacterized protein n=1 Tax=Serpula lacrymans var. lacrymans (strain S7.3) TaxID=936435 RepID=F8PQY0_SERL3|nr:hypothetical protein SERLA73DRAFT_158881 [Serpula lacrymans var. lacrymans S7.3]
MSESMAVEGKPQDIVHGPTQDVPAKISAYYSLVFPNITFYLQTLNVTIGRRCIPAASSSSAEHTPVDVDLGPLKSVSRLHAKIEYEEEEERFILVVVGRNGAWVDGVWSGSGSRVPLTERSQIQIASRTFHFVLPPPPPLPEDSPSPSSQSSAQRPRSPSVDITSISPPSSFISHSPPPIAPPPALPPKLAPEPEPQLPNSNSISRAKNSSKKRKKSDVDILARPKPEVMPPKPQFTYAQLCYRAIKSMGGKATLQDICTWMMENHDWYRYNEGAGWENSVRHNLSSGRAFKKMERSTGERGKGFYWSVDEKFEHIFEEQEAKSQALAAQVSGGKDGKSKKKDKGMPLEPALKRSIKGDLKGTPLPPPLTSAPLAMKSSSTTAAHRSGLFTTAPLSTPFGTAPAVKMEPSAPPQLTPAPPNVSASGAQSVNVSTGTTPHASSPAPPTGSTTLSNEAVKSVQPPPSMAALPPSVCLPIIVGPVPPSHPSASSSDPTAQQTQPIVLHNNTLILNPTIFSHLTPEQLRELEALGAQKALEILQGYIVRFLKERMKTEGSRGRGRGKPKRGRGAGAGRGGPPVAGMAAEPGPFTSNTLPLRNAQAKDSELDQQGQSSHPPAAETVPVSVNAKPPIPVPITPPSSVSIPPREDTSSPIIVVDDGDSPVDDEPAMKRRRLDASVASG